MWEIPIELKRLYPELSIICDPSHIGGKRTLIAPIAQKAMDLTFDGLMIESHNDPDNAWSDAAQQITPKILKGILKRLILRNDTFSDNDLQLQEIRSKIDSLDEDVISKISNRMDLIEMIGILKKENNIPILQVDRWSEVLQNLNQLGADNNLSQKFMKEFLNAIHTESIRKQTILMNK